MWFKLKLASYEIKQSQLQASTEYLKKPDFDTYQSYKLKDLEDFIKKLGPKNFRTQDVPDEEEDPLGTILYFRILILIGNYSEAVTVLASLSDFRI